MEGERLVDAAQYGDEVGFEGLDSLLGNVATMMVGGDKLVCHVILLYCCLEFCGTLIVKHVMRQPSCLSLQQRGCHRCRCGLGP